MTGQSGGPVRHLLFAHAPRRRMAALFALMLASSLTEGVGIVMLVPLLTALGPGGAVTPSLPGFPLPAMPLAAWLALFVTMIGLRAALVRQRTVAAVQFAQDVTSRVRSRLLDALLRAQWRVAGGHARGPLLSRLSSDLNWVGYGLNHLTGFAATAMTTLIAAAAAFALSPLVALTLGAGGGAAMVLYRRSSRMAVSLGANASRFSEQFYSRMDTILNNLRLIKLHGRELQEGRAVTLLERRLAGALTDQARLAATGTAVLQSVAAAILAVVIWCAVERWQTSPNVLLPLIAVFARLLPLISAMQVQWQGWLGTQPSLACVTTLISELDTAREPYSDDAKLPPPARSIALSQVSLLHASGRGLNAVNCVLPAGTLTVVTGASGAGKSTLADILAGLLEPQKGALLLDGEALPNSMRLAWRRQVAYVQQEPMLLRGSIRQNLAWAHPDASEAQMEYALRAASAQFVFDWKQGLDTLVGDDGCHLSGGERQRIALARCLLLSPSLLILDEPTIALDPTNTRAVVEAVALLKGRTTILAISHGEELQAVADQTLRIDKGQLSAAP